MYCTRWVLTVLVCLPNNMHWKQGNIRQRPLKKILQHLKVSLIKLDFVTIGKEKCKPVIPIIINGPSGSSCNCSAVISAIQKKKHCPFHYSLKSTKQRELC